MTNRADVYRAIDSERAYQDMRIQRDQGSHFHSESDFILFMEHYLTLARTTASTTWGPEATPATMEIVRKVVALGVACMEHHGAPQRKGFEVPVPPDRFGSPGVEVVFEQRDPEGRQHQ